MDGIALSRDLEGHMAAGSESEVAEGLFDSFVQVTSDEKLAEATKDLCLLLLAQHLSSL